MGMGISGRAAGAVAIMTLAAWLHACGGSGDSGGSGDAPPPPPAAVAVVTVSAANATIEVGGTTTLGAVARDAAGNTIANASFAWVSSNAAVASVANGVVAGLAPGKTNVTASAGGVASAAFEITVLAPPATSETSGALIARALADGLIDADTALVYEIYATFGDSRLPAEFRGQPSDGLDSSAVATLIERYDTLAEPHKSAMTPFVLRPFEQGSWTDPARGMSGTGAAPGGHRHALATSGAGKRALGRPDCTAVLSNWRHEDVLGARIRVWYDVNKTGHDAIARTVAGYYQNDIWPRLIGALGFKEPKDDSSTTLCDGGDDKLDVYIVDNIDERGLTYEDFFAYYTSPVYILIRANQSAGQLQHTAAHEFMHAIHWAYTTAATQKSYGWFRDALANWAADEVYPGNAPLNKMASCHLKSPELALTSEATGYCTDASGASRNYGAYLPLRFFAKTQGVGIVRTILEGTQTATTAVAAMDTALAGAGGLKQQWPKFGQRLWNKEAVRQLYGPATFTDWDRYGAAGPAVKEPVLAPDLPTEFVADLFGAPEDAKALATTLAALSNKYYHFQFTDVATRSVMFHNTFYNNRKRGEPVAVHAYYKAEGQPWREEDWSEFEWIGFCRDAKDQRLEDLVVVFSSAETNSTTQIVAATAPRLLRNNVGCWGFKGTATRTLRDPSWNAGGESKLTASVDFDYRPGGTPNQLTDPASGHKRVPIAAPLFAKADWTLVENYVSGECGYSLNRSGVAGTNATGGPGFGSLVINNVLEALPASVRASQTQLMGTRSRAYTINVGSSQTASGTVTGTNCVSPYETWIGMLVLSDPNGPSRHPIVADDGRLVGTFRDGTDGTLFEWNLTPVREP